MTSQTLPYATLRPTVRALMDQNHPKQALALLMQARASGVPDVAFLTDMANCL